MRRRCEPADRAVLHFLGLANTPQTWAAYAASAVVFNMAGAVFLYLILRFQGWLPFNPQGVDGMGALQAFNVAVSFVTGTNWQSYSGEVSVSYFSQGRGPCRAEFLLVVHRYGRFFCPDARVFTETH